MATFVEFKRPKGDPILLNVEQIASVLTTTDESTQQVRTKVEMVGRCYYILHDEHTYERTRRTIDEALRRAAARPVPLSS